ncbi:TIGR03557 family F420-dependent LLM class oxidoreductase [Nakamurella flava]|uniref:TIGR03557 family F420-dependent LLM class oxidoreductase n=1 Tax=Nakamurella flava TaxID=2576308 RepID=A0A4U6QML3_9ACTN|nr:TIGR03557 family F420-dependent LLM class oxidoreductase [Nakamurella flava]TKV61833.1 TIGR03557 family F420-dependent LLM class oxidoreductase [Nakamurella flava]
MQNIGYTLMTEQTGPRQLVEDAVTAERVGFDFAVSSDHYFPWLDEMGHSPNAWVTLGAVARATERMGLMTYVTCPTFRYHPAVVAQQAATLQILSDNRFTLGVGSGENLNEHIIGAGWPGANERQERLVEALTIINALFDGGYVNLRGDYYRVDSAKLWDLPDVRVPIGAAVSGKQSCSIFAPLAQVMVAIDPEPELGQWWDEARQAVDKDAPAKSRKVGQLPISWGADKDEATQRAHTLFRWSVGGWKVNAELPSTAGFDQAAQTTRPEDVAEQIPCGNDVDAVVEAAKKFADAGYTDLALVQIGADHQDEFFRAAESEIIPALRAL